METKRVLLVDDDPSTVRMAFSLLRDEPYRLLWATTPEDALHLAQLHQPDAILLSWTLSDMTGDEFADLLSLHPSTAEIPLILMSLEPWLFSQHLRDRAAQVVNKTYLHEELAARVRDAMGVEPATSTPSDELARIRDRSQWWEGEEEGDWRPDQRRRFITTGW